MPARKKSPAQTAAADPAAPPPEVWMSRPVPGGRVRLLRDRPAARLLIAFDPPADLPAAVGDGLRADGFAPVPEEPGVWAAAADPDRWLTESVIAEGALLRAAERMPAADPAPETGRATRRGRGR